MSEGWLGKEGRACSENESWTYRKESDVLTFYLVPHGFFWGGEGEQKCMLIGISLFSHS